MLQVLLLLVLAGSFPFSCAAAVEGAVHLICEKKLASLVLPSMSSRSIGMLRAVYIDLMCNLMCHVVLMRI